MRNEAYEQEALRVARHLHQLIRIQERSQRSIEKELGLGSAILSKMLNGTIRLQVSHVLMILDALGIPPGQFFRAVYPKKGREHAALVKLRQAAGDELEEDSPEFDARVRRSLLRLLGREELHEEERQDLLGALAGDG
jgi:transcriptional regulator with XRE-family HTH domain